MADSDASRKLPDGDGDDSSTGDEQMTEVADLLRVAAHGAPPLEQDPIAAMLGLVPDAGCRLDSRRLVAARKKTGIRASELAQRLQARGWTYTTSEIFRWETQPASLMSIPPAVVQAIAATLEVTVDSLLDTSAHEVGDARIVAVKHDSRFAELAARWARAQRISIEAAIASLDTRMLATVHRGDKPDPDQLLASLDALITAVEKPDSE